jgi:hypothetical protein
LNKIGSNHKSQQKIKSQQLTGQTVNQRNQQTNKKEWSTEQDLQTSVTISVGNKRRNALSADCCIKHVSDNNSVNLGVANHHLPTKFVENVLLARF